MNTATFRITYVTAIAVVTVVLMTLFYLTAPEMNVTDHYDRLYRGPDYGILPGHPPRYLMPSVMIPMVLLLLHAITAIVIAEKIFLPRRVTK